MTMQTKRRQLIRILSPLHPLCKHFIPICASFFAFSQCLHLQLYLCLPCLFCLVMHYWFGRPCRPFTFCHCCTGLLSDLLLLLFTLLFFFFHKLAAIVVLSLFVIAAALAYFHICFHFLSHPC